MGECEVDATSLLFSISKSGTKINCPDTSFLDNMVLLTFLVHMHEYIVDHSLNSIQYQEFHHHHGFDYFELIFLQG